MSLKSMILASQVSPSCQVWNRWIRKRARPGSLSTSLANDLLVCGQKLDAEVGFGACFESWDHVSDVEVGWGSFRSDPVGAVTIACVVFGRLGESLL